MYVESHDRFTEVGAFDPETGQLEIMPRPAGDVDPRPVGGHFARLDGTTVVFYREGGQLWLAVSGRHWLADESTVSWSSEEEFSRFSVSDQGSGGLELTYRPERREAKDLTPFVEDEDFDFGLYVYNVVNDSERSARIYAIGGQLI